MQAFWTVLEEQETIKEIRQHTFPTFCECQIDENYLQTYFGYIEKTPERNVEVTERKLDCDVATDKKIIEVPTVSSVIDSGFPSDEKNNALLYDMATKDWNPFGITDTSSGDLLLCLRKDDQSKVVRYSSTGTVLQEIQDDSQGQPLYQLAWYITENVNGDVIVTDLKRNVVIAVDRLGVFRSPTSFMYA
ncbi:uncharacterized protein LOC144622256 [Crassostrea virginica]